MTFLIKVIPLFNNKKIKYKLNKILSAHIIGPLSRALHRVIYRNAPDPYKVIRINPLKIEGWYPENLYNEIIFLGQIKNGNWHLNVIPKDEILSKSNKYRGIKDRYVYQKPWRETALFKERYMPMLENGKKIKSCTTLNELERLYYNEIDKMFLDVKQNGISPPDHKVTPLFIHIGPEGEIYYTDEGNHRVYMAIILRLSSIPVKVLRRHKNWQKIREQVVKVSDKEAILKKYNYHSDLLS